MYLFIYYGYIYLTHLKAHINTELNWPCQQRIGMQFAWCDRLLCTGLMLPHQTQLQDFVSSHMGKQVK